MARSVVTTMKILFIAILGMMLITACGENSMRGNGSPLSETESESILSGVDKANEIESESATDETAETGNNETSIIDHEMSETYPETVVADEASEDEAPYFGIMHATILSVVESDSPGDISYTFLDNNESGDNWTFTGLEIGDIEAEMTLGSDVAILFNGDVINDSENVLFLVILPEGNYEIKKATGIVTDNMMSTFTMAASSSIADEIGEMIIDSEIHFLKDNCRMDEGALDIDRNKEITVYYVEGGELGNFPLRIYA